MEITKSELERIYRENTLVESCKILSISKPTLLRYIDIFGIRRKGKEKLTIIKEGK